eukprot:4908028-Ditylum_brightwellii.AAC.1
MSGDGNVPSPDNGPLKQQGGHPLPFLDHDFTSYHNTEWYQWEINVQLQATGATQLNSANTVGQKSRHFLLSFLPQMARKTSTSSLRTADAWKLRTFQLLPKM